MPFFLQDGVDEQVLLQQVWGDSYEGFDRTVDNHITRLRKKLGTLSERIDTV